MTASVATGASSAGLSCVPVAGPILEAVAAATAAGLAAAAVAKAAQTPELQRSCVAAANAAAKRIVVADSRRSQHEVAVELFNENLQALTGRRPMEEAGFA